MTNKVGSSPLSATVFARVLVPDGPKDGIVVPYRGFGKLLVAIINGEAHELKEDIDFTAMERRQVKEFLNRNGYDLEVYSRGPERPNFAADRNWTPAPPREFVSNRDWATGPDWGNVSSVSVTFDFSIVKL